MKHLQFFATCPKAMEQILAEELLQLGAQDIQPQASGVAFVGNLHNAYNICLWSRIANRILLVISEFEISNQEDLYQGVYQINWFQHMSAQASFAVSCSARHCEIFTNTHFAALKAKDAVVDQMRVKFNKRPEIDKQRPDIRINVFLQKHHARISLDLSGESLHKRSYRDINIEAPIKENLAAAMLYRSDWLNIASQGGSLLDPMCGSGTLLIEAALMAADIAPGLLRDHFGFLHWKQHDAESWHTLLENAQQRKIQGLQKLPVLVGYDQNKKTVNTALQHVENASFKDKIHIERRDISLAKPAESWQPGLIICNPPYGERLGNAAEISELYTQLGVTLRTHFQNWQATLIISNPEMGFKLGIRSKKPITLYNGSIECKLLRITIDKAEFFVPKISDRKQRLLAMLERSDEQTPVAAEMFANRLKKNLKKLQRWARREHINCFRIYDADLPEYAVAIDLYQNDVIHAVIQEYEAPKNIPEGKADRRLAGIMAETSKLLELPLEQIHLKFRRIQKSLDQYEKQSQSDRFYQVEEHGCHLLVNFEDYLDTGLFLDHRPLRYMIQKQAQNNHFLNLFAYTGSASVHAAVGGAMSTTTVDMSKTYLDWASKNMLLNPNQGEHRFIRANCLEWLQAENEQEQPMLYDLIFVDPPTFSNSKRMQQVFDIQQQHVSLIKQAVALLAPGGMLYFSTNFRRFQLQEAELQNLKIEHISPQTIAEDFARNPKIHYCWKIYQ